ncbi:hypothetical protein Taro_041012 [Colocasia esculenta]|uniref:TOG domain-containing protein n=1 Tax=Colocasia esculenta TaxID=4460 RepID=A0A843WNK2_COLES|nr:hypothetical protein [Colocasia esculenta]
MEGAHPEETAPVVQHVSYKEAMEKAIKNKVAKAVVPAIDVMFQALSEFGAKVVPPKKILKMLPELFDHQDQNVRASSKGLTLELCRWIGKDPVKSILFEKMRDTMKKELEAELANVSGIAKPTRKIRSEQDKEIEIEVATETPGAGPSEESVFDAPQEIDEYELVDPVDILTPLEKSGFWDGVLVTDVNLAVSVEAIQAIGNVARGLRNHFSGSSRFLLPTLLEKLKEKKLVVTEALTQTLQSMYKAGCLTLADVIEGMFVNPTLSVERLLLCLFTFIFTLHVFYSNSEYYSLSCSCFYADVKVAVKNKVPLVRSLTLNWVTFCIETSNKATVLKAYKEFVPICMECLNDGTPEVRDAAFAALAAIAKSVGMKPLEKSLEKLDDVRKKKLSEMIGGSEDSQPPGVGSGLFGLKCCWWYAWS